MRALGEALVIRFSRLVYAIARRAGLSEADAADVFQEVFEQLIAHLDQIQQPARVRAWIVTTALLPSEDFRTAFFADKLAPYAELARVCLQEAGPGAAAEALGYVERARSRSLLDVLDQTMELRRESSDA
jgi:hypothetical protein